MWREGYVSGGETRFFVRALGHGDDLALLLHGWPEDGSSWRRVAPLLVDAGYRVVAPDLKGFGRSEAPRGGYDPQTLADEISQLIHNLHVRKAVLVGHDWGGAVAVATAFRHPGLVRALVTMSSPFRQLDLRASWHVPLLNIPIAPELAFRFASRPLVAATVRAASVVREPFTDEVIDTYAAAISANPSAWLRYYRGLSRRAVIDHSIRRFRSRTGLRREHEGSHRMRVPTAVVWGEEDPATPFHLAARVAHDLDATLVPIPGAGHFVHEEDPLAVARAIVALAGTGAGAQVPISADPRRTG
ncbi:MAG: alpha/beta hydrolase [Nitriliruptor sp.]|uniref:alpha/beta fold hydrolase n=1 Tax=Nitriliruptor sp. TaxID=2448056 RepID=UPI0034A04C45